MDEKYIFSFKIPDFRLSMTKIKIVCAVEPASFRALPA